MATPPSHFDTKAILAAQPALHSQTRAVKFQDVDAAGTIYFARTFEYFSDAYLALLMKAGLDVPGMLARREQAAPLVHAEADYLAPLFFGDQVEVEVVLAQLGTSSTRFAYRVLKADGTPAAVGQTHHVWIDSKRFQSCPMPPVLRAYLETKPGVSAA